MAEAAVSLAVRGPRAGWQLWGPRVRRHKGMILGFCLLSLLVLIALLQDLIARESPTRIDVTVALEEPSWVHLMGTDQYGRDVYSRVIHGARISLTVGLISVGIAALIGTIVGLVAGYYGAVVDAVCMRIVDVMLAFPGILLALGIVSVLGPNLRNLMLAVGIAGIPVYARIVRGSVLVAKEHLYVEAARAVGAHSRTILVRHILPNVIAPIVVTATLGMGGAILAAAALSFIGLGSQPPTPEWGPCSARAGITCVMRGGSRPFPAC